MVEFRDSIVMSASTDAAWALMSDVEHWPTWTSSVRRVALLSPGPLVEGSQARIWQPWLPPLTWTVDSVEPGVAFSWTSTSPGVASYADHRVEPVAGGTRLTLLMRQTGPLAGLTGLAYGRLTRRYLRTECEGFRRRAEELADAR